MRHDGLRVVLLLGLLGLTPAAASAQEFAEDFNTDDVSLNWGFSGKATPVIPSGRTITWVSTGGWNGTGAARITVAGCTGDCSLATNQGNIGWDTPAIGGSYSLGATKYIRFRLKLDGRLGNIGASKFILMGTDDGRIIFKLGQPFNVNSGCQPSGEGNDYYGVFLADTDPTNAYQTAQDFGLTNDFSLQVSGDMSNYAMLTPGVNIGFNCAPFVIFANAAAVADIKPQNTAAISQSGWVHYQVGITSGTCGTADINVWANNNTFGSPTVRALNMNVAGSEDACAVPVTNWEGSYAIGGYWGQGSTTATSFIIDDVEISDSFDASFYELAGEPPAEGTPRRLRFKAADLVLPVEPLTPATSTLAAICWGSPDHCPVEREDMPVERPRLLRDPRPRKWTPRLGPAPTQ